MNEEYTNTTFSLATQHSLNTQLLQTECKLYLNTHIRGTNVVIHYYKPKIWCYVHEIRQLESIRIARHDSLSLLSVGQYVIYKI